MNLATVSISTKDETCNLPQFYCLTVKETPLPRGTIEKVCRAADRRNEAVRQALEIYPRTTDILMIDSWYLNQTREVRKLIAEYQTMLAYNETGLILGAYTWSLKPNSIRRTRQFYDTWVTPEAFGLNDAESERLSVKAVGGCYIFPREVWEKHPYSHEGLESENTYFCRESGLRCFISFKAQLQHPHYSILKRARVKLNLGRFSR